MRRWVLIVLILFVVLLLIGAAGYYWYIGDGNPPATVALYELDMSKVRAAADELPGGKASDIRVETVATFNFPAVASVGGDGWDNKPMAAFSYQVILPTDTIIIDSAFTAAQETSLNPKMDDDAYARMDMGLSEATEIVVTHEHPDHIGGIVAYSDPGALGQALRLNKEQLANVATYGLVWPDALNDYAPIDYDKYLAIAPGVVLIRAPGHTPGSQMIYVKREDGREVLFIGDIGWTMRNVETGKGRPRLLSDFMLYEDRNAVFAELATLKALHMAEPNLLMVPGHDLAAVDALTASGALTAQFKL